MLKISGIMFLAATAALLAVSCSGGPPAKPGGDATVAPSPQAGEWLDPNAAESLDEPPPPAWNDRPEMITEPDVVAVVGDGGITRDEFFAELEKNYRAKALEMLIDDAIIRMESERIGLALTAEDVRAYTEKIENLRIESMTDEVNRAYRGQKTLEEYLRESRGVGVEEFRAQNIRQAVENGMAEKQMRVEMLVSYERLTSARVKISHIQVNTESKALDIIKRLNSGATFDKLAQEESEDAASRTRGGTLDPFNRGDEEFRKDLQKLGGDFLGAVFEAKLGLVPGPLKSERNAYHVVMVLETQPAQEKTFAELRPAVEKDIEEGITEMDGYYWRERKRCQYKIEEKNEGDICATVGHGQITVAELHAKLNALFGRETIQRMITGRIVKMESARIGLANNADEIQKMAERMTDDNLEQLKQLLAYQYPMQFGRTFTLEDYIRQEMGKSLADYTKDTVGELIRTGQAEEHLTLAKLVSHYLMTTRRVTVQQALFDSEYAARDAWLKLRQGADFSKIAQKNNPEPLMEGEGVLPSFSEAEYDHRPDLVHAGRNLVKVAFATGQGRFSGVFRCKDGWRIIKALEQQQASDLAYTALRERIRDEVFQGRRWMLYVPIWTRIKARSINVAIRLPA